MHPYLQFYELSIRIYYDITCVLANHMIPSSLNAASKARETSPGGRVTRVFFIGVLCPKNSHTKRFVLYFPDLSPNLPKRKRLSRRFIVFLVFFPKVESWNLWNHDEILPISEVFLTISFSKVETLETLFSANDIRTFCDLNQTNYH